MQTQHWRSSVKVGDLVIGRWHNVSSGQDLKTEMGIVIELDVNMPEEEIRPSRVGVLWSDGEVCEEWTDDLEVANESR